MGTAVLLLKKTSPVRYEEALKKGGVEIKNNIAILSETGEKYTGKIQRHVSHNKKEITEYIYEINCENKSIPIEIIKESKQKLFNKSNICIFFTTDNFQIGCYIHSLLLSENESISDDCVHALRLDLIRNSADLAKALALGQQGVVDQDHLRQSAVCRKSRDLC